MFLKNSNRMFFYVTLNLRNMQKSNIDSQRQRIVTKQMSF